MIFFLGNFRRNSTLDAYSKLAKLESSVPAELPDISRFAEDAKNELKHEVNGVLSSVRRSGGPSAGNYKYTQAVNTLFQQFFYTEAALDMIITTCSEHEGDNSRALAGDSSLLEISTLIKEDLRALSVEKFGVYPEIEITEPKEGSIMQGVPELLEFACVEILKNSVKSVIEKYGQLNLDDLENPPITISCSPSEWVFHDLGKGLKTIGAKAECSGLTLLRSMAINKGTNEGRNKTI